MDVSEKWGTDVDAAVELALADLKLTIDEVDVTVLEEPSRGFFGIGSKLALVRVEKKKAGEKPVKKEAKSGDNQVKSDMRKKNHDKKPLSDIMVDDFSSKLDVEEKPTTTPKKREIKEIDEADLSAVTDHQALTFLHDVAKQMGIEVEMTAKANDKCVFIDIQGKDSGTIIGKRGQTLDAIQYLTSLVVNKDKEDYIRVIIDAENYREKREKTLEHLAQRLSAKVIKSRRSVKLEPMNPYERKVIHATLQSNPRITTRSEGQDPYRRVIIELKK